MGAEVALRPLGSFFRRLDPTEPSQSSVGKWSQHVGGFLASFNIGKALPVRMTVCWDSVIDKKAYETEIWFSRDTWQQMLTAYPDTYRPGKLSPHRRAAVCSGKIYYRNKMIIGLPPGGKVRVWLKDNRNPVVLQNPARQFTLTGDDMLICKNVPNKIDFSYIKANGYDPFIRDFIKEKPYPYGHW